MQANPFETAFRSASYILGIAALVLAAAVHMSGLGVPEISDWLLQIFGGTFICLFVALLTVAIYCWTRITGTGMAGCDERLFLEIGLHAANGIATLGLTYTLIGISLGVGVLTDQPINPSTVQNIISGLTRHFSLAFMTSVIALPTAAACRALLIITWQRDRPTPRHDMTPKPRRDTR